MQIFCSFPRSLVVPFLVELFDVFVVVVVVVFFFSRVFILNNSKKMSVYDI